MLTAPAMAVDFARIDASMPRHAPLLSYRDETGAPQKKEVKGGKLTIVHFWATWCIPCVEELPEVDAAQAAYAEKGLTIIPLSLDFQMQKAKDFLIEKKLTHLPVYLDNGNSTFQAAKLKGLPATLFINELGIEIARAEGPLDWTAKETVEFIEGRLKQ